MLTKLTYALAVGLTVTPSVIAAARSPHRYENAEFKVPTAGIDDIHGSPDSASVLDLLVRPEVLNGRRVIVYGYLRVGREATGLFLTRELLEDGEGRIRVSLPRDFEVEFRNLDRKRVLVEGVVRLEKDTSPLTRGRLEQVARIWPL